MRRFRIAVLAPLCIALLATAASADWPPGGKLVLNSGDLNGVRNARIITLPNSDLVILGVGIGGNSNTYGIQRLTRDGQPAPGMPATGVRISTVIKGCPLKAHSVVVDDASRVWHVWAWNNAMLESVGKDGLRVPVGTAYSLGSSNGSPSHAAPAPGGEVFLTMGSRLKRLTPSGVAAAGWTSNGVGLPTLSYSDNAVLEDGTGGAVVFMRQSSFETPAATRIDGNGTLHTGWTMSGLVLSSVAPTIGDILPWDSQLLPSGPAHMLAVWSLDAGSGTRRLMMQRFSLDGVLDPAWPADGIEVVAPETLYAYRAIPDGSGGAYVLRQAQMRPVATHITATGALLGSADTNLLDADAVYAPTYVIYPPGIPDDIVADVTQDGGLLVGWTDARLPERSFRLRWVTPELTASPDKPAEPLVFIPASPHPSAGYLLALKADGPSGAFLAWSDYHDVGFGQNSGDVWMTYTSAPTTTGVRPGVNARLSLSAPRPNPATASVALDLTLPDESGARVDLLDVAGRVVRTQLVAGAGAHAITFDALSSLAPGLYFARVTSRDRSAAVRVVVSR